MPLHNYTLKAGNIEINVTHKKIRGPRITIRAPYGQVCLSVPISFTKKHVQLIIELKLPWIQKHQAKFGTQQPKVLEYVTGETLYFQGKPYVLSVVETKGIRRVEMQDNTITLFTKDTKDSATKEALLNSWYRDQMKNIVPKLIKAWEEKTELRVKAWGVKRMKTRWGTCNPTAGRIWLNLELIKKAPNCLEYVIVHEMVHLLEVKHNKRFFAYMDKFLPSWRDDKNELNYAT